MTKVIPLTVEPGRSQTDVVGARKGKEFTVAFIRQDSALLFYETGGTHEIIALASMGMVYHHCQPGTQQRAVNEWANDKPLVRVTDPKEFDFLVGQVFMQAGLPLIRR